MCVCWAAAAVASLPQPFPLYAPVSLSYLSWLLIMCGIMQNVWHFFHSFSHVLCAGVGRTSNENTLCVLHSIQNIFFVACARPLAYNTGARSQSGRYKLSIFNTIRFWWPPFDVYVYLLLFFSTRDSYIQASKRRVSKSVEVLRAPIFYMTFCHSGYLRIYFFATFVLPIFASRQLNVCSNRYFQRTHSHIICWNGGLFIYRLDTVTADYKAACSWYFFFLPLLELDVTVFLLPFSRYWFDSISLFRSDLSIFFWCMFGSADLFLSEASAYFIPSQFVLFISDRQYFTCGYVKHPHRYSEIYILFYWPPSFYSIVNRWFYWCAHIKWS